jgi:hypothetical protein
MDRIIHGIVTRNMETGWERVMDEGGGIEWMRPSRWRTVVFSD